MDVKTPDEAHLLAAYLNAHPVRAWLGGFLHGKQIGTSVFEFMHVPKFDSTDAKHRRLAGISVEAHAARAGQCGTSLLSDKREAELVDRVGRIALRRRK